MKAKCHDSTRSSSWKGKVEVAGSTGRRASDALKRLITEYRAAKDRLAQGMAHGHADYSVLTALAKEVGRTSRKLAEEIARRRRERAGRTVVFNRRHGCRPLGVES
ncbi:hypothetical protein SAMN04487974_1293 [Pelagibacterium luteolum]|nr:hypothetical protein GCM10011393_40190 [Sphingopyxis bauzanensis]SDH19156.1 hypothetical protein SAMN04487974_1293 [Pelagibacterium luteolum]